MTQSCSKTYPNKCFACKDKHVLAYTNGPCNEDDDTDGDDEPVNDGDIITCPALNLKKKCKKSKIPQIICAELNYFCPYGKCTTYFFDKCDACGNQLVSSLHYGLCPRHKKWFKKTDSYTCQPNDRKKGGCPKAEFNICGLHRTKGLVKVDNVCSGCKDKDISTIYDKECPEN